MDERSQLLDLIYETVLEPRLWVTVMERMADTLGGNGGFLSRFSVEDGSGTALLARCDPAVLPRYRDYFASLNPFVIKPRPREYMSGWAPWISAEEDYLTRESLVRDEFYNDFMLPEDMHGLLLIDLGSKEFEISTLNIHCGKKRGRFDREAFELSTFLQSHLIRAFRLGELFTGARERGCGAEAALDSLEQGVIVVDGRSCIRYANPAAEKFLGAREGVELSDGRLAATQTGAARKLEALIGAATAPDAVDRLGGCMLAPSHGRGTLSVTVAPLQPDGLPMVTRDASALVTIADAQPDETAVSGKLVALFALTPAEVRIALALLRGATPRQTAKTFGVSVNTVRSQMASIFGKTDTTNQPELARLMMRLAVGPQICSRHRRRIPSPA